MKGTHKNICYLDFDGVVHPDEVYKYEKEIRMDRFGHSLFEWNRFLEEVFNDYPDLKIVLSTTWVRTTTFHIAKSKLPESIQDKVVGATYHSDYAKDADMFYEFPQMSRYETISQDINRRKPSRWIALDDDKEGWPEHLRDKLIYCRPNRGISSEETRLLLREALDKMFAPRIVITSSIKLIHP